MEIKISWVEVAATACGSGEIWFSLRYSRERHGHSTRNCYCFGDYRKVLMVGRKRWWVYTIMNGYCSTSAMEVKISWVEAAATTYGSCEIWFSLRYSRGRHGHSTRNCYCFGDYRRVLMVGHKRWWVYMITKDYCSGSVLVIGIRLGRSKSPLLKAQNAKSPMGLPFMTLVMW